MRKQTAGNEPEDGVWNFLEYDYDRYGNLVSEDYRTGAGTKDDAYMYTYDLNNRLVGSAYGHWYYYEHDESDNYGNEELDVDSTESAYVYDTLGRLIKETQSVGGKSAVKSYTYNEFGGETGSQSDPSQSIGSGLTYTERQFLTNYFQIATTEYDVDAYRSKQKAAEESENKAIAGEIINDFDTAVKRFLTDRPDNYGFMCHRSFSRYTA